MPLNLTKGELLDMRSVLERSLQRAQQRRLFREVHDRLPSFHDPEADALAAAVADLNDELAGMR